MYAVPQGRRLCRTAMEDWRALEGKLVIPRVALGREAAQKVPRVDGRAPKARSPSSHHRHLPLSSRSLDVSFKVA